MLIIPVMANPVGNTNLLYKAFFPQVWVMIAQLHFKYMLGVFTRRFIAMCMLYVEIYLLTVVQLFFKQFFHLPCPSMHQHRITSKQVLLEQLPNISQAMMMILMILVTVGQISFKAKARCILLIFKALTDC